MGSLNSVPVISQIKSMVQAIGGDLKGAKETQEEFVEKGLIASQINSLVQSIKGDNREAKRIQLAFGKDMEIFSENLPVVGHIKSAVHSAMGDKKKAQEVAISATKSTVVALAGVAGVVCGPAAAACGGSLATGALAAWDGVDTAIAGENRGIIKGIHDMSSGKASVGEAFDTVAGLGLTAVGGAVSAHVLGPKVAKASSSLKTSSFKARIADNLCRKRRSIEQTNVLFSDNSPDLDTQVLEALPESIESFNLGNTTELMNPDNLIGTIYSVFIILKLMSLGHPRSKPYYDEICNNLYPGQVLEECEATLFASLSKYSSKDPAVSQKSFLGDILGESFESLLFEMNNMVKNNELGKDIQLSICLQYPDNDDKHNCIGKLDTMVKKIKKIFANIDNMRIRVKRQSSCVMKVPKKPVEIKTFVKSNKFRVGHTLENTKFENLVKSLQAGTLTFEDAQMFVRNGVPKNTWLKKNFLETLDEKSFKAKLDQSKGFLDSPYVDFVEAKALPDGTIRFKVGNGKIRIGSDESVTNFGTKQSKLPGTFSGFHQTFKIASSSST